ncbi:hypothetical protein KSF73_02030 [Burkholderiaceae bacterium DAT-1]|nr:hypothetical protein [Burkholderiaceae bacterium DAT-1]
MADAQFSEGELADGPSGLATVGVCIFALCMLYFQLLTAAAWVPLLDSANLALHEAGHPLLGLILPSLTVYGGTLFQLLFPLAVIRHFHRLHRADGVAVGQIWLGENMLNIGRYMADARTQVLPLVGGGEHDWTEIFSRWHVLGADRFIGGAWRVAGVIIIIWACWRMVMRYVAALEEGD